MRFALSVLIWITCDEKDRCPVYTAVTGSQIISSKLLQTILLTEYKTRAVGEQAGMQTWTITRR